MDTRWLFVAVLAATSACTSASGQGTPQPAGTAGAVTVVMAKATNKDVPVDIDAIGNVEASTSVSVRSQVTGQLQDVVFREGDYVTKGSHLFTIDPRPFQAQLDQAQANYVRDQALLAQSQATLARDAAQAEYAQVNAEHNASLSKQGIVAKDQMEQTRAAADALVATVNADRAAIQSAQAQIVAQQAAVENAKLQLAYTVIKSPIEGRTGSLNLKVGNLVSAATTELVTIAQVQPVNVTFTVPALHLDAIKRYMAQGPLTVVATPQQSEGPPAHGTLSFIDNLVDASTDSIRLKASMPNAARELWPGEFVRVTLHVAVLSDAVVVPSQAVQTGQDGQYVFVVKRDSTVDQRTVTTGQRVNDDIVVSKGLNSGETVVTEGQLRLEPGSKVTARAGGPGGGPGRGGRGRGQGRGRSTS